MPRAATGGYRPGNTASAGTAAPGQPSLWGGSGDEGPVAPHSYSGGSTKPKDTYLATGGTAQPDIPHYQADGTSIDATASMPSNEPVARGTVQVGEKPATPTTATVGSFGLDVSSPAGLGASIAQDQQQAGDLFSGLSTALFGRGSLLGGPAEQIGNILGKAPLVGPAVSGAQTAAAIGGQALGTAADLGGKALGAAADTVSGAAEHIPVETVPFVGQALKEQTDAQFAAAPETVQLGDGTTLTKAEVQQRIAADPLAGGHLKTEYVRQANEVQQLTNPDLYPELKTAPGSLGDTVVSLLGGMGSFVRPIERAVAGAGKSDGLNRLQAIAAVAEGQGKVGFGGNDTKLNPVEEHAYTMWKSGAWSADQALTFLAASSSGFSHDAALEIAGQVALDPTVWGSVGAAGLSKLGIAGVRLAAKPAGSLLAEAGSTSRFNLLGRLAENAKVSNTVRAIGGTVYTPIQDNMLGQAAKVVRTIIDPLHAVGGHKVVGEAAVDVASEATTRVMESAYGELASKQVAADMNGLGLLQKLADAKATYSANKARGMLVRQFVQGLISKNLAGDLRGTVPGDFVGDLTSRAPKDFADLLKQDMVTVAKRTWDQEAVANLGQRMASFFGEQSPEEWTRALTGKSSDYLGQLHAATYGAATRDFLGAIGEATNLIGPDGARELKLPRLILLNRETLTDIGAQSILQDLKDAATAEDAAAIIRAKQAEFPSLKYISLDPANLDSSIEKFQKYLGRQLEDGVLPSQLVDREVKKLPQPLQDLYGRMAGTFDFGFRPEDDKLWGLGYDTEGRLALNFEPWVDHVAATAPAYRGFGLVRYNAAGMPIVGEPLGKVADYIEAAAKTLTARVNSATITENAKSRFVELALKQVPDLPQQEARQLFEAVAEAAQLHRVTVRGLSPQDMWQAVQPILPDHLRITGKLTERSFMNLIVHAYEGDLRFVGLTQKFTGRAKAVWAGATGNNFAGQFSENLYTKIKFWANPIFQTQERIEPVVLNAMRGSNPAFGTKLTEVDRMAAREARNLLDSGIVRASDIDQAEFSSYGQVGQGIASELARKDPSFWDQLRNVSGAKRLNEIRTFQSTQGASMRRIWEQWLPGEWDKIKAQYEQAAGALLSDDEVATRMLAEQSLAGDVTIQNVIRPGDGLAAFQNAIGPGWHQPSNFGELKGLALDDIVRAIGWTTLDKKPVKDVAALRAALADSRSGITIDRVKDALTTFGAHPDYVRRVENALNFHWDGFWRTVAEKYSLKPAQTARLQAMIEGSARVRGMTPVDYLSQVFSPMIGGGNAATVEALGSAVSVLRAAKGSSVSDLAEQLVEVFRHHLDPSGQETLLQAFEKDLPQQINSTMVAGNTVTSRNLQRTLENLRGGWTRDTTREFTYRMLKYIEGEAPSSPFEAVTDAARGIESARTAAADYVKGRRLPLPERRYFPVDESFGQRTAAAYDALPSAPPVAPGPPVTAEDLTKVSRRLKPTPQGVDAATVEAYQAFVDETLAQYKAIQKAGIRFEPTMTDPYKNSAEMIADVRDNHRLKVFAGSAAHPLLTDAQNVMFRGVHDYFAHAAEGFQFGPRGELNAAIKHSQMYTATARRAMLTETHGQNSFVNFSDRAAARPPTGLDSLDLEQYGFHSHPTGPNARPSEHLDRVFETAAPLKHSETYYRSISQEDAQRILDSGGVYTHPGYMSTADTYDLTRPGGVPYAGPNDVVIKVEVPAGARVINVDQALKTWPDVMPHFQEAARAGEFVTGERLLPFGQTFDVSKEGDQIILKMRPTTDTGPTVAQVNKAAPGTIYAEQKAGLLPQPILDEFGKRYIGVGAGLESNPDVIRAVQQFSKWSKQALAGGLLAEDPQYAELLTRLTGIPTDAATPANHMHALMIGQVTQAQRLAAEDAFRLQYFARSRTFLERSINHPFFGIYPASYMWGKIAPEMARFMALSPFGIDTGVGLRAFQDFQVSAAVQRELDPEFDKTVEKLGHSSVGWFLGYMLPALPWDVGAAAPGWMRSLAAQGIANQQRVDRGEAPKPIDLTQPIQKVADIVNPFRSINQAELPLAEVNDILSGGSKSDKQTAARDAAKSAARQARLEKDVAEAIVNVETQQSRMKLAKSDAARLAAQRRIDAANFALDQARKTLAGEFPDSPKLQVPVGSTQVLTGTQALPGHLADALGELLHIFR